VPEGGSGVLYHDEFTPVAAAAACQRGGGGHQLAVQRRGAVRSQGRTG
jgi:hypothetical protein